ncbi:hypothetical protein AVDCRST_MAG94-5813 [uncultured Leptolyngbya sp.]|uniref:Uncharacterized protein n=1 Tax=uncultured Leptolyngbya sp. TaxID=332963 RepID=A0A6J4NWS3_9CYAN|nr:hypothetical protein AVDCRST_MAG94-5813 [uncultured Leptolyngbya sp.]
MKDRRRDSNRRAVRTASLGEHCDQLSLSAPTLGCTVLSDPLTVLLAQALIS